MTSTLTATPDREALRNVWIAVDINHSSYFWPVILDLRQLNREMGRDVPLTVRLAFEALLTRAEKGYEQHRAFIETQLRDRL